MKNSTPPVLHFPASLISCFLGFLILFLPNLNHAQFQRNYGNTQDDSFSKVIKDGTNYYVLGQEESSGVQSYATVTRLNANGIHQWTLSLDIPSVWNDAVLTPNGDLLVVGATLPFDASTKSLMGVVTSSGGGNFSCLRSYDEPGRDYFFRIIKNPVPENAAFPYYILGSQNQAGATATTEDVVLLNVDANCNFNWKKVYTSAADDEFFRDLEAMPNGDLLLAGNNSTHGLIFKTDNLGTAINAVQIGQTVFSDIGLESTGGFIYAVANEFNSGDAHVLKFDQDLIIQWDNIIPELTSISQVWEGSPGEIYAVGWGFFNNENRSVILKMSDNGIVDWVKYLNEGSGFIGGSAWYMPSNELAYTDSRVISGGFGGTCAFISVSDMELFDACSVSEEMVSLESVIQLLDSPFLPPIGFWDLPMGSNLLASFLDWQQAEVCTIDPCEISIDVNFVDSCGHVQVTSASSGPMPYSYQWCSGENTPNLDVVLPCGPNTFCVTLTCGDGSTATASQQITVSDNIPPTALCVPPFGVDLNANCIYNVTVGMIDGGSFDNCQIQSMSVSPTVLNGCGVFPVTLTVEDWCGNISTCMTEIQTIEVVPPSMTCPPDLTLHCDDDLDPATTGSPVVFDNCDPNPTVTYSDAIFGQMPCDGLLQRTWTVTDSCGNVATCVQNILVFDNEAPMITCPSDMTVTSTSPSPCDMVVNSIQWLSVSDNCGTPVVTYNISGATILSGTGDASGATFNQGVSTVTYTATDECGNAASCSFTVTVECTGCPPACQTNLIDISTGADPLNAGSYLAPGGADPMWSLIAAPPNSGITSLPQPANLIGPYGNSWDAPPSTWLSANPFNNYGVNNCTSGPQDCTCPPFVYQRSFCLCDDGNVTFDFGFWSDNNGSVELWKETVPNSGIYILDTLLADNCSNLNSVVNFNAPPVGQTYYTPPVSVNTTLALTKGKYSIRINNWNISGVAMGVNLLGSVTGLNLEKDICCSAPTGTICVTKYHDTNCDGVRDINTSNWTYIDPGLNNWGFNVAGTSNNFFGTTNLLGQVCFTGLTPNSPYTVSEVLQTGWTPSNPPGGTITVTPTAFSTTNVEFGNCSESCECGPHEFLYSVGKGPLLPKFCGDVIYIPEDLPFQFLSSFSCFGACNPLIPTVDFVLTGPPGFTTISNTGIPANPGYSLPIIASTFTIAGTYTLTLTGHCGNKLCPCTLTFIYPGDCCKDQELFCAYLENNISIIEDNALCKATVKIDSLPVCDSLEWINWGDNSGLQIGPFGANSMPMHTYSGSGMYIISYLAVEKDPLTGLICFEKVVADTIFLSCDDSYCPLNLVQNGDFMVGTVSTNDEDICNALRWCGIWPDGIGISVADFYNSTTAPPPGTAPLPLSQGNYAGMWCRKQATLIQWREGFMNELQQTIQPNSGCYDLELKLACTGFYFGTPELTAYGVTAPALASGSQPSDGASPPNLALFPAGDAVELWNYPIPSSCDENFQTISFPFNSNILPVAGISHIFFTRSDNTNGGVYIAVDDVCLKPAPCPDTCCTDFDEFCQTLENEVTITVDNDSCKATVNVGDLGDCNSYLEYISWGDGQSDTGPFPAGSMPMHFYSNNGSYGICYLAIELDTAGFICFEKIVCDTIDLDCFAPSVVFDGLVYNNISNAGLLLSGDSMIITNTAVSTDTFSVIAEVDSAINYNLWYSFLTTPGAVITHNYMGTVNNGSIQNLGTSTLSQTSATEFESTVFMSNTDTFLISAFRNDTLVYEGFIANGAVVNYVNIQSGIAKPRWDAHVIIVPQPGDRPDLVQTVYLITASNKISLLIPTGSVECDVVQFYPTTLTQDTVSFAAVSISATGLSGLDFNRAITIHADNSLAFCTGESVNLSVTTYAGAGFQWQKDLIDVPGAVFADFQATETGNYRVKVTTNDSVYTSSQLPVEVLPFNQYYLDADGDGFGDPTVIVTDCIAPQNYVLDSTDCDDDNPEVNPAATEIVNGIDDDCDMEIDETCCNDFDEFCQNVENAVSISVNNDSCKAIVNIGDLEDCDYLEYVNWGDGSVDTGPFNTGSMTMHTYPGSGSYEICYLAIELDEEGFICFEKIICDTIDLVCNPCCTDSIGFFNTAANVQTNGELGDCMIHFNAMGLDSCMQITYAWGDNTPNDGPHGNNVAVWHTYPGPGTYTVCYFIEEVDENGNVCWTYEFCEEVLVLCDSCCLDFDLFCQTLENEVSISVDNDSCKATVNIGNLPDCDYIEYIDWGPQVAQGPFPAGSMPMFVYPGSGSYEICYLAIELDAAGFICFEKIICVTIDLDCDCTCGTYSDLSYRPEQGAPNIPAQCGDTLTALCDGQIPWTLGGNFLCDGDICPDSTQMSWMLMKPVGSSSGTMTASPGFNMSIPGAEFSSSGTYQLILKAICGQDTCYCEFIIEVDCDNCCTDFDAFCQNVENAVSISLEPDTCKAIFNIGDLGDCDDYIEYVDWGDMNVDNGPFFSNEMLMHIYPGSGVYEICYLAIELDSAGFICFEKIICDTIDILCTVAINDLSDSHQIRLFPNPTTGEITLYFEAGSPAACEVQVIDLWGRTLAIESLIPGEKGHSLSLNPLPEGVYFVKVMENNVPFWIEKVIKQ